MHEAEICQSGIRTEFLYQTWRATTRTALLLEQLMGWTKENCQNKLHVNGIRLFYRSERFIISCFIQIIHLFFQYYKYITSSN